MLNKKRIAMLALAAVMTLGAVGCGGNPQLTEQLNLGEEYMTNGDYENAIAAYQAAIEVDSYAWEAHSGLILAMVDAGKNQQEINDAINIAVATSMELAGTNLSGSEAADLVDFYEIAMTATSNDVVTLNILIAANDVLKENPYDAEYQIQTETMIKSFIEANNYEAAQGLIDRLRERRPDLEETIADLEQQKEEKEAADAGYVAVLTKAVDLIEAEDWTGLADLNGSDELVALEERIGDVGNFSYTFTEGERAGKTIGYYSMEGCSCNQWYYGDIKDGLRDGYGGWYYCYNNDSGLYVDNYVGGWTNDVPNGSGYMHKMDKGLVVESQEVVMINGALDGTYKRTFHLSTGETVEATYTVENGVAVPAEVPDWIKPSDGAYIYCIAYYEVDGKDAATYVQVREGRIMSAMHINVE